MASNVATSRKIAPPAPGPVVAHPLLPAAPQELAQRYQLDTTPTSSKRTIFGRLFRGKDRQTSQTVMIKQSDLGLSRRKLAASDVHVFEDAEREALIMCALGLNQKGATLTTSHLHAPSCGLSHTYSKVLSESNMASIASGRQYLCPLVAEYIIEDKHHVVTEHAARGDLFDVLTGETGEKFIGEAQARTWFRQICLGVQFMHAQSIAHRDLSPENICVADDGSIRIIDFGMAVRHPEATSKTFLHSASAKLSPCVHLAHVPFFAYCCHECHATVDEIDDRIDMQTSTTRTLYPKQTDAARHRLRSAMSEGQSEDCLRKACNFMVRPVCNRICKPGKLSYISPELLDPSRVGWPWDVYKNDIFALGVIFFILLTRVPPFAKADLATDVWFKLFYTSKWMTEKIYSLPVCAHFANLSRNAWDLLDSIFKPQHIRPTIDQILAHPFFIDDDPGNQPVYRVTA